MNKLWVRLLLAFGLVIGVTVIAAGLLANYQVTTQFRQFMTNSQAGLAIEPDLMAYYTTHGTWDGVETVFETLHGRGQGGGGMGHGQGMGMQFGRPTFVLADSTGRVVYSDSTREVSNQLSRTQISNAIPLSNQAQSVGYLLVDTPAGAAAQLTGPARSFVTQTNRALWLAGLMAGGLAVLVSIVIARELAVPLRRMAAAAGQIAQGQLDQRVPVKGADELAHLATAFNQMATDLQQAEQLRRNLIADVAHELRTPVSVIQGNLQAILDDVYPLEKAEIASIYDETLTLSRLIADLRDLAQAEAGQLDLNRQPVELGSLIETLIDLFGGLAHEKEVTLELEIAQNLPPVSADSDRVRQILHNLLANAIRHTPVMGQVKVVAEVVSTPDQFVKISVTDTGPGIAPEDLPHVFDRFWRADKSRSRQQGGSGLGLAIAKQLVEAQGGRIGVESQVGQGSCFWFVLPGLLHSK
ncbi:MAG: HAMP domain-containing histidine kinase [Anaerolineae bacterium]|nr:HAMP domain-containing histidine kinase [Anaerolineae bacterium]